MNAKLVESLAEIIQSLTPKEKELLNQKMKPTNETQERHFYETASPEERLQAIKEWAESHSHDTPILSDEAISRESIYGERGYDLVSFSLKLGAILPREVWEQIGKLQKLGSRKDWQEIVDLFARSLLEHQYKVTTQKLTKQFNSQWLDSLTTEEDLLNAAVELTKNE